MAELDAGAFLAWTLASAALLGAAALGYRLFARGRGGGGR